jgi:CubicO group peptidase (beta-lactamase class C family)
VGVVTAAAQQPESYPAEVQGSCEERFGGVRDVLAASLAKGTDVGASVAITVEGRPVVDIWGGWVDENRTRPWERNTITNVWSTTKTMTALCALMLVDEGYIDLDAPVDRYWPEFAASGKAGRVLFRHLLGHTAGLPGWTEPMTVEDLYDWEKATGLLAAQEPWWEPGSASGYHALTQGYLVGEVVRRVTGQSLGTFFRERVAEPLGADFHIGLDTAEFGRVANVIPPPPADPNGKIPELTRRTLGNPPLTAEAAWTEPWRRAEIPAANGHGNARSVAAVQSVVANGGEVGGVRLLSEAGCERIFIEQAHGTDLVLGGPVRLGTGYGLPTADMGVDPDTRACFWGGWGGSVVVNNLDTRMTVAYVMNKMGGGVVADDRGLGIVLTAHVALIGGAAS